MGNRQLCGENHRQPGVMAAESLAIQLVAGQQRANRLPAHQQRHQQHLRDPDPARQVGQPGFDCHRIAFQVIGQPAEFFLPDAGQFVIRRYRNTNVFLYAGINAVEGAVGRERLAGLVVAQHPGHFRVKQRRQPFGRMAVQSLNIRLLAGFLAEGLKRFKFLLVVAVAVKEPGAFHHHPGLSRKNVQALEILRPKGFAAVQVRHLHHTDTPPSDHHRHQRQGMQAHRLHIGAQPDLIDQVFITQVIGKPAIIPQPHAAQRAVLLQDKPMCIHHGVRDAHKRLFRLQTLPVGVIDQDAAHADIQRHRNLASQRGKQITAGG